MTVEFDMSGIRRPDTRRAPAAPSAPRGLPRRQLVAAGALVFLVVLGAGAYLVLRPPASLYATPQEQDPSVRFMMEAYDAIAENYWIAPGDFGGFNSAAADLPDIFRLAVDKVSGGTFALSTTTRSATAAMLGSALSAATSTDAKQAFALQTVRVVLYNLLPVGRNSLLSHTQEVALRQDVANVNPATGAVEPSVFPHVLGRTLYLDFDKIAPTTLQEFAHAVDAASTTPGLDSMILDMRGNVGGALDFAQAFLGLFVGGNQYAFDLYHQGADQVQRTAAPQDPELSRYGEIAILTDDMTQSTAELVTAIMKRYRLAYVVGTRTRGWGSVEDTYPLTADIGTTTSFSLLLVNSLTLRDDQQPIEQNGVEPDIDTATPGWQKELSQYFSSASLVKALESEATAAPLQ